MLSKRLLCLHSRDLEEEGLGNLDVIQSAPVGAPQEVLLDMAGTSDFGAAYS